MRRYNRDLYDGIKIAFDTGQFAEIPEKIKKFRTGDYIPPDVKKYILSLRPNEPVEIKDREERISSGR